jgi:hypothetical protein
MGSTTTTDALPGELTSRYAPVTSPTLSRADRVAFISRLSHLESVLFDGDGHARRRLSPERATALLDAINTLRRRLGWLSLDMEHHQCWPAHVAGFSSGV